MDTKEKVSRLPNLNQNWFYIINLTLAISLIVAGLWMLFRATLQSSTGNASVSNQMLQQEERIAPEFTLTSLSGEQVALSDYAGQVVLINLWATWCPPCKAEMPAINAFYEDHKEQGFVVLAVNHLEDAPTVHTFIKANGFGFPVLLDTEAEVTDLFQVSALPVTFIIDRNGLIQHTQLGEITSEQLQAIVGPLL